MKYLLTAVALVIVLGLIFVGTGKDCDNGICVAEGTGQVQVQQGQ